MSASFPGPRVQVTARPQPSVRAWIFVVGPPREHRLRDTLWHFVGAILNRFTPDECANYLKTQGMLPYKTETL